MVCGVEDEWMDGFWTMQWISIVSLYQASVKFFSAWKLEMNTNHIYQ